jgi:hypothetical protein
MTCKSCASERQAEVDAEINLHFPRSDEPGSSDLLIACPVLLCLRCGLAEFSIPQSEASRNAAGDSS